ncbi:PREDICTED: uncharacterized protein LOC105452281 [Wasmannia auropunctata]|uniref:uncharacterized protein LOC105452281 n=1 Tax=Wasmannia auropunctata TaxID=64793 RepID=UPI0005EF7B10|nr:PREDICTED: uncharacterized protein LOC105452281 [Wasmannia auropunctata]
MPANCIAPGCTSGYKSNPEKIHFFMVPKDKNIFTLWQNATRRKDIRAGQFVCEKHFLAEDILWKREIKDSNGHVLGISPYKVPRLRKGTIPSQFPWTEIPISMDNNNTPLQDTPLQETAHKSEQNDLQEIISDEPSKFSFTDLFTCTLRIPVNWTRRTVVYEGIEIESFINVTCRKIENNFMTSVLQKLWYACVAINKIPSGPPIVITYG